MRAHSDDSALEIVARLIESKTANKSTPYYEHDSVTSAGYRVGLAASRRRTYTGDSWCRPVGGTASESNLGQG